MPCLASSLYGTSVFSALTSEAGHQLESRQHVRATCRAAASCLPVWVARFCKGMQQNLSQNTATVITAAAWPQVENGAKVLLTSHLVRSLVHTNSSSYIHFHGTLHCGFSIWPWISLAEVQGPDTGLLLSSHCFASKPINQSLEPSLPSSAELHHYDFTRPAWIGAASHCIVTWPHESRTSNVRAAAACMPRLCIPCKDSRTGLGLCSLAWPWSMAWRFPCAATNRLHVQMPKP